MSDPEDLITSLSNPTLKRLTGLKNRKQRLAAGEFLIEGAREVDRAIASRAVTLRHVVISPEFFTAASQQVAARASKLSIHTITLGRTAFQKLSLRQHPDGLAVVASTLSWKLSDIENPSCVLLLEEVEKPGNLGAILRTADAADVSGVLVVGGMDLGNPNLIRASQGSIFAVPVVETSLDAALKWATRAGMLVVVATPEASTPLWDVDLSGPVLLCVGSEREGVSAQLRDQAHLVRIPMAGTADSLNVSVAAALLTFEWVRQKR